MGQTIELREIPRGNLEESLETAARKLRADPGPNYAGDCDMFRRADGFPICRGKCQGNVTCHLVIIGIEGSHSDLYDYLVFCTCMTDAQLDKLIRGQAEIIRLPDRHAGKVGATPVGEGAAQCWLYVIKSEKIKVGQGQRTQMTSDTHGCVELVSETIEDGEATFVVQCKKDESGKCKDCHAVVTLRVMDKDGNNIAEKKVEITCRHR